MSKTISLRKKTKSQFMIWFKILNWFKLLFDNYYFLGIITFLPPMYICKHSGTEIEPSSL